MSKLDETNSEISNASSDTDKPEISAVDLESADTLASSLNENDSVSYNKAIQQSLFLSKGLNEMIESLRSSSRLPKDEERIIKKLQTMLHDNLKTVGKDTFSKKINEDEATKKINDFNTYIEKSGNDLLLYQQLKNDCATLIDKLQINSNTLSADKINLPINHQLLPKQSQMVLNALKDEVQIDITNSNKLIELQKANEILGFLKDLMTPTLERLENKEFPLSNEELADLVNNFAHAIDDLPKKSKTLITTQNLFLGVLLVAAVAAVTLFALSTFGVGPGVVGAAVLIGSALGPGGALAGVIPNAAAFFNATAAAMAPALAPLISSSFWSAAGTGLVSSFSSAASTMSAGLSTAGSALASGFNVAGSTVASSFATTGDFIASLPLYIQIPTIVGVTAVSAAYLGQKLNPKTSVNTAATNVETNATVSPEQPTVPVPTTQPPVSSISTISLAAQQRPPTPPPPPYPPHIYKAPPPPPTTPAPATPPEDIRQQGTQKERYYTKEKSEQQVKEMIKKESNKQQVSPEDQKTIENPIHERINSIHEMKKRLKDQQSTAEEPSAEDSASMRNQ